MSSGVHYQFSSRLDYDTITFDGPHISVCDLKKQIMKKEKLRATKCELQISNAETKEEYTDDDALIHRNFSVIVRRVPVGGIVATSRTYALDLTKGASGTSKVKVSNSSRKETPMNIDSSASVSVAQFIKTANLAEADASEEEKIKAMMVQSCHAYDPINYTKIPPPSYTCFRCGKPGHYIKNCPTKGDKNFEPIRRIKRSSGIPRSFMMEVKDPNMKGAMLSDTGKYVISTLDAEAYARGKKEKPPFLPEEPSSSSEDDDPIPDELLCPICQDTMTDAVVIPCCGNSYCDECIRTALLESDEHTCPTCHQDDVSPDTLIANKCLRKAVDNFKNGTGSTQRLRKQICPPPPRRPLIQRTLEPRMRPPISRQQDPLRIPVTSAPTHAATSISSPVTPDQSSLSSAGPVDQPSTPAPVPDVPATVPVSVCLEKTDGPSRDPDNKTTPAAALASDHPQASSSIARSAPAEEKDSRVPVLGRRNAAHSAAAGRPGWPPSIDGGRHLGEHSQRTRGPSLPATPLPPPPLCPPPPHMLSLPPGVPPPQVPPRFPPRLPPPAGYSVPPPGWPPAPMDRSTPWGSTAVRRAPSNTLPTIRAPFLSREEFYRVQRRLQEEEKKKSKRDFAKARMEYKENPKERGHSFSRSKSPHRGSSPSRSSWTYSKSRPSSSHPPSYSRSFSYSQCPYPRRGRWRSRNDRSRSRSRGYHRSRSRSPPYRRYHSRSRSPVVFRGRSPNKRNRPQRETGHHSHNRSGLYPEKLSARDGHGHPMKDRAKSEEKENENPPGDGQGNKHKKHRKRRKEEENEGFPNTELLRSSKRQRKC